MRIALVLDITVILVLIAMTATSTLIYFGLLPDVHPLKRTTENQTKIACVGDSITYGLGISNRNANNYPQKLNNMLGSDYCVNNYGYSSRCVQSTTDLPYRNEKLFELSLEFAPDVVFLMLGTNDSKESNWVSQEAFLNDYNNLVQSYLSLSSAPEIFLICPIPVLNDTPNNPQNATISKIRNVIKNYGAENNLEVIDFYDDFKQHPEFYRDDIHPNNVGAELMANKILNAYEAI